MVDRFAVGALEDNFGVAYSVIVGAEGGACEGVL